VGYDLLTHLILHTPLLDKNRDDFASTLVKK